MRLCNKIIKNNKIQGSLKGLFSKKKGKNEGSEHVMQLQRQNVEIQQKYRAQSAALYDHYVKLRNRPLLTLDNYQIAYTLILERIPIFMPYKPKHFQYIKTKYDFMKKTKKYQNIPKDLQIDRPDFLFGEYERVNQENTITHRHTVSKTQVYQYAEHSRYWRYSDPSIVDDKSVQTYATETVYFITKNKQGEWTFPSKIISQKDKHTQVFTLMTQQLFGGSNNPLTYFDSKKPIFVRRIEKQDLDRGNGVQQMFYKGFSVNGIPNYPTQNYSDYAWVPKPLLSKYFNQEYFNEVVPLIIHSY